MTDALQVRAATRQDAPAIAAIYAQYVLTTAVSFEETPPSAAEMLRRMTSSPRLPWLVAAHGAEVLGYAYGSRHRQRAAYRWSVESSVYVAADAQRRGAGRRLYEALLDDLRALGYVSVFAGIALPNPASIALHERVGFEHLGVFRRSGFKHGVWHDVGWWQQSLSDRTNPCEPQPWRVLQ